MKQLFYDADRVIWNKVNKSSEIGQDLKTLISVFFVIFVNYCQSLKGNLVLDYISPEVQSFLDISLFVKTVRLRQV